jgi:integrase
MNEMLLLEPSFAEVAKAIERAVDIPAPTGTQWLCSLRQISKALDKPMEVVQARWTAARFPIDRLHHAVLGMNAKTLANHKANVRAALRWFAKEEKLPSRGMPLAGEWQDLRQRLTDRRTRAILSSAMRYFSARRIAPAAVDEIAVEAYMQYRARTTALVADDGARRAIARAWNGCIGVIEGWPERRLMEPTIKATVEPNWEKFPEGLRRDIEAYVGGLARIRRDARGNRLRPCKPSTIRSRRAELIAAARMAVREGVPIESLSSLQALVHPDVAELVIDAYWKADGPEPRVYTIDLGWKFISIARSIGGLDDVAKERLDDMRTALETYRRDGLTEKNMTLVRQVISGNVWSRVINLPEALMAQARLLRDQSPVKAAVTAQLAVAIAILTNAPVRLGNLVQIRLNKNLIKPGGPENPYMLVFPDYDVKNRVNLEFPFDQELTGLIDEYLHRFRATLLRGANELWLFPGEIGGCKDAKTFSGQITERVEKATDLFITVHQFRHAAAAIWLQHKPGDYESVRRCLGHRNIQTTINFYCGLETLQANRDFGDLVRKLGGSEPDPPQPDIKP